MTRILAWTIAGALTVAGLAVLTVTPDNLNPLVGWALILAAVGITAAIPIPTQPHDDGPLDQRDVDLWCRQLHAANPQQIIDEAKR